jgi:hypothetical protein
VIVITDQFYNVILSRPDLVFGLMKLVEEDGKYVLSVCKDGKQFETILEYPTTIEGKTVFLGIWPIPVEGKVDKFIFIKSQT